MKRLLFTLLVATIVSASAQTTPSNLTNGLVAFYPFEGNSVDVSGSGNNATPAGSYQYLANGLSGGAIRINGDNSQFYAGGGHVLLPSFTANLNSAFTCSLWVKDEMIGVEPVGVEHYVFFAPNSSDSSSKTYIALANWSPAFVGFTTGNGSGGMAFDCHKTISMPSYTNGWKHLVVVSSPTKFACYLNGIKFAETNAGFDVFPAPLSALGRHWWPTGSSARMSCTYDSVRIWNRILTDQEIKQLNAFDQNLVTLGISIKTLRLTMNVELGKSYQLESSTNLPTWSAYGSPFVASFTPIYQDVDVVDGYRYFRLKQLP